MKLTVREKDEQLSVRMEWTRKDAIALTLGVAVIVAGLWWLL